MRRNLVATLAIAAVAAAALGAGAVFGAGSQDDVRPDYADVNVRMNDADGTAPARALAAKKAKKPKVIYLSGTGSVNTAAPPAGTGAYIDFALTAPKNLCPRVVDGGVSSTNLDLFQQGTYVEGGVYHVLMGLDDGAASSPTTIDYNTHLICLKGVK
jgi:hypothetical protein